MKRKIIVKLLFLSLFLTDIPCKLPVCADVPTGLALSANPSNFVTVSNASVFICMAQQNNSPGQVFNTSDLTGIAIDASAGSVTSVDPVLVVNSKTLSSAELFCCALQMNTDALDPVS